MEIWAGMFKHKQICSDVLVAFTHCCSLKPSFYSVADVLLKSDRETHSRRIVMQILCLRGRKKQAGTRKSARIV